MLEILLIDDETSIRLPVGDALRARGHRVATASDGDEAMARLDSEVFHLVVSDVRLPKGDGFSILRRVRRDCPWTDVLLMTAYGTIADAVAAMKEQAIDYVTKPFDVQELVTVVDRIDERRRLREELREVRAQLAARRADDLLIGRSPPMARLREQIDAVAASDAAVLLTGESGTGKELVARMLHDRSTRRERPFVAVNCAAVPHALIEAELFGYERGAFTGALRKREGRFAAADGGTLFLDEIGEMPLEAQSKLLRVLQDGSFEPIGTNTTVRVDVRLISATNRELRTAIEEGEFRQDLYFRIRVLELVLPALRDRPTDLPLLVEHFLREFTPPSATAPASLSPAAWAAVGRYPFPGNVRELKHALQHASILARGGEIQLQHLPRDLQGDADAEPAGHVRPLSMVLEEYEREHILRTLKLVEGERQRAAELLGISRKSLWKKMAKYGLSDFAYGDEGAVDARERLYRQFAAEEVASAFRHRLVNKIAAVGALTFHLRRQLPAGQTPASALGVLPMIDAELAQASQTLDLRFLGAAAAAAPLSLGELAQTVLTAVDRPPGVEMVGPRESGPRSSIDRGEADLALYCLVENAVEAVAGGGTVSVRFAAAEPRVGVAMIAIEVSDDGPGLNEEGRRRAREPFFTTKPGRLGIGLGVAARIAQRWRGAIELDARPSGADGQVPRGLVARLLLPVVVP